MCRLPYFCVTGVSFLKTLGYDPTALPDNYHRERPPNMDVIHRNLLILKDALNPDSNTGQLTKEFVIFSTNELQKFVSEFKTLLLDVVAMETSISRAELNDDATLRRALSLLSDPSSRSKRIPPEVRDDLVKDLQYLLRIEEMDREWVERAKVSVVKEKLRLTHEVPVSGILMAAFRTLEIDHQNAIEMWS